MQREKGELTAPSVLYIEGLAQVAFMCDDHVVGHVGAPHRLAKPAGDRYVFKRNIRVTNVGWRVGYRNDSEMAHTNEDYEYQTARQHKNEERVAHTLILPETR